MKKAGQVHTHYGSHVGGRTPRCVLCGYGRRVVARAVAHFVTVAEHKLIKAPEVVRRRAALEVETSSLKAATA